MKPYIERGKITGLEVSPAYCQFMVDIERKSGAGVYDIGFSLPKRMLNNLDDVKVGMAIELHHDKTGDKSLIKVGETVADKIIFDKKAYWKRYEEGPGTTLKNIAVGLIESVSPCEEAWIFHGFVGKGDHPVGMPRGHGGQVKFSILKEQCTNADAIVEGAPLIVEYPSNATSLMPLHVTIGGKLVFTDKKLAPV